MNARTTPARLYEANEPVPGTVYRVLKLLAQGGMGNVYDVEDVTVGKRYVLKTLTPELVGRTDLARRMDAEARVLARLSHPNIVEVITAGTTADSLALPYLVMERLNGQSLRTVLDKRGAVEFPYACKVAIDLLDALEHAHEHGVIHRDVKPENVFLHRTSFGVTVTKLLDFGVMRLSASRVRETQGRFVGTLRYAAPEQLTAQEITPAVDVYAAGLVLYEMLCGCGPFDDESSSAKVAKAHVVREPPRASTHVLVPPGIDDLLARALAKNPGDRPADAFSFAAELRKYAAPARASGAPPASPSSAATNAQLTPAVSTAAPATPSGSAFDATAAASSAPPTKKDAEELQPTELLTEAAVGDVPLNRASTVAASSIPDPVAAVLIDRGAETRSMVVEPPLAELVPPTAASPASPLDAQSAARAALRRTAPLVPTPVPAYDRQDFSYPKETGITSSTDPAAVPARRGAEPVGRVVLWGTLAAVVLALVTFAVVMFRANRDPSTSGATAAGAAPRPTDTENAHVARSPTLEPTVPSPSGTALVPGPLPLVSAPPGPSVPKGAKISSGARPGTPGKAGPTGPAAATSSGKLPGIDF